VDNRTCNWMCVGAIGAVAIILANGISGGILWRFHLHISFWLMCSATMAAIEAARRAKGPQLESLGQDIDTNLVTVSKWQKGKSVVMEQM